MYRSSFLKQIPTPPLTGYIIEDLSYNMHVLPYAKYIKLIPDILYYYRWGGYTNHYDSTILPTALTGYSLKMKQIEKYHLSERFIRTTSIELLNYLNTFFYYSILYKKLSVESFVQTAGEILMRKDVSDAVGVVRSSSYRNQHVEYMLKGELQELYSYEIQQIDNNRIRKIIKDLLLK